MQVWYFTLQSFCTDESGAGKDWIIVNKFYVSVNNEFLSQNQNSVRVHTPKYACITQNERFLCQPMLQQGDTFANNGPDS
jgi:hypothetical protein